MGDPGTNGSSRLLSLWLWGWPASEFGAQVRGTPCGAQHVCEGATVSESLFRGLWVGVSHVSWRLSWGPLDGWEGWRSQKERRFGGRRGGLLESLEKWEGLGSWRDGRRSPCKFSARFSSCTTTKSMVPCPGRRKGSWFPRPAGCLATVDANAVRNGAARRGQTWCSRRSQCHQATKQEGECVGEDSKWVPASSRNPGSHVEGFAIAKKTKKT